MATVMFRNFHGVVAKALAPFVVQKGHPVQYGGKWNNRSLALKLLPRRNPVFTSWHTELDQDGRAAQMQSAESAAASKEASDVRTSVDSSGAARGKAPQKRTSCDQENYFIIEHNLDRTVFRNVPEGTTRAYLKERMVLQMSCFEGATPRSCDAVARKIVNALWPYIETDSPVVGQIFAMLLACHVPNQFYFPQLFASAIPGLVVRDITREDGTTQPEWIWIEDQAWYESWYDEIFTVGEKPIIYKAVPVKKILPSDDGMTDTVEKVKNKAHACCLTPAFSDSSPGACRWTHSTRAPSTSSLICTTSQGSASRSAARSGGPASCTSFAPRRFSATSASSAWLARCRARFSAARTGPSRRICATSATSPRSSFPAETRAAWCFPRGAST